MAPLLCFLAPVALCLATFVEFALLANRNSTKVGGGAASRRAAGRGGAGGEAEVASARRLKSSRTNHRIRCTNPRIGRRCHHGAFPTVDGIPAVKGEQ